ncbi:hypothetical protein [Burkholderia sp. BCC0044]|uniref:hypothetical protein n=1 Tax=Burkholderia sp. BCC0044 TaxID=2676295 RepID=UPI001588ACD3|nr:hypothetical protein [Burkholderia sp. BCC0044]
MIKNDFLDKLLTLQQDGQQAISGPANWLMKPVLHVQTSLHAVVEELASAVVPGPSSGGRGRWHFFVGSPGNGKSAGAGHLARLLREKGHLIRVSDTQQPLDDLRPSDVPYLLEVCEPGKVYPYLFIAQDASVLPNPYDPDADPATALEDLLIDAETRGVSVVVCTNRGVVERIFARHYREPDHAKSSWFRAIKVAVGADISTEVAVATSSKKHVFDSVQVTATSLDRRSLMLADHTLDQLLQEATKSENWAACEGCASSYLCPFKANRDWIAEPALRKNVLNLLLHAELYDGQVVVLREALAIVSLLLAGCPHDYQTGGACDWVHTRIESGDLFALASRRLYMLLFSSYSPLGIEPDDRDRRTQLKALKSVYTSARASHSPLSSKAIPTVLEPKRWPSTDVGAQRLLGRARTLAMLDPFSDTLPADFLERWNETWTALQGNGPWITQIERDCYECWQEMQKAAASSPDTIPSSYRWLTRWITAFTTRAGALVEGVTTFNDDLSALVSILGIAKTPTKQQLEVLKKIEKTLAQSLDQDGRGIAISPAASLRGDWKDHELKPHLESGHATDGTNSAHFRFGKTARNLIALETKAFVWLKRRAERGMASATFPSVYLETAQDAMLGVAVTSGYDMSDDLEIYIDTPNGPKIKITRSHGVLDVESC